MDFHLTREQNLVRQMMKDFTETEVKPIAAYTDETCTYPRENIEKLFDMGVMGMIVPKEMAAQVRTTCAVRWQLRSCPSSVRLPVIFWQRITVCAAAPSWHTVPRSRSKKYLRMLTEGHKVGAFALTEPDAGSDASKGTCTAVLDGDHYVLNGSKIFITNGYVAEVFVVFAMTDPSKGTKGISAFIVGKLFPRLLCGQA